MVGNCCCEEEADESFQKKQLIWSEAGPSGFSSLPASIHGVKSPTNEEGTAHREEKRVSQ